MAYALGHVDSTSSASYAELNASSVSEELADTSSTDKKKHIFFREGKIVVSKGEAAELVLELKKPFDQTCVEMHKGLKSRFEFLHKQSEKINLHFVAIPIDRVDIFEHPQSVLINRQTHLTSRRMGGVLEHFNAKFSEEQACLVSSLLDSGHQDRCLLPNIKVPPSISIKKISKTAEDRWPTDTATNCVNIFILAELVNRNVIFFSPNMLDGKNYLIQSPDLTCHFYSLEEILSTLDIYKEGRPIWVTSDPSHLYIFQDQKTLLPFIKP